MKSDEAVGTMIRVSVGRRVVFWIVALVMIGIHTSAGRNVTLAWDPNAEPDLTGYRLHYGTVSGAYTQVVDVGNVTSATVSNLDDGTTYFFAVTARNAAALESITSNEVVSASVPNQPPVVDLTNPGTGTTLTAPATITLAASASDPDGIVAKVEFFEGTRKVGEDTSSPFAAIWNNVPEGDYQIAAVARDDKGATTRSSEVSIHVRRLLVSAMRRLADRTFELTISGAAGRAVNVEVSEDLETWRPLMSAINTTGTLMIIDADAAAADRRFYRVSAD